MVNGEVMLVRLQIAAAVVRLVDIDDSPSVARRLEKGEGLNQARKIVLYRTAGRALFHAKGDADTAARALIITNGQASRLPQCIQLLRQWDSELVGAAYRLHGELTLSPCSIVHMCRIISALGYIPDEDDDEIAFTLDEIAMAAVSKEQEFFWLSRIPQLIRDHGPFLELILDRVRDSIEFSPNHFGALTVADEEEFWESQASYDQEAP